MIVILEKAATHEVWPLLVKYRFCLNGVEIFQPKGNLEFLHLIWRLSSLYGVFFLITFTVGYVEVGKGLS